MPELKQFPASPNMPPYNRQPFTAFQLLPSDGYMFKRFVYPSLGINSTYIPPYEAVFFITTEEAQALLDIPKRAPEGWRPTERQRTLLQNLFNKLPSGDSNRWPLILNDDMAHLITTSP
jgi:hypothetical protein